MMRRGLFMKKWLFLVLFCQTSLAGAAGSCGTEVRLDKGNGGLAKVPIMIQGSPSCFAFSAIEMAESWRRSHKPAPPVGGNDFFAAGPKLFKDMCDAGEA